MDISLRVGMSEPRFYVWKGKCARLVLSELGEGGSLREKHVKLKHLGTNVNCERDKLDVRDRRNGRRLEVRWAEFEGRRLKTEG